MNKVANYHGLNVNFLKSNSLDCQKLLLSGISVSSPSNGDTVTISDNACGVIIAPKGPLVGSVNLVFPQNPQDSQVLLISFTQDVQNLVIQDVIFANKSNPSGNIKAGDSVMLYYDMSSKKWYKLC